MPYMITVNKQTLKSILCKNTILVNCCYGNGDYESNTELTGKIWCIWTIYTKKQASYFLFFQIYTLGINYMHSFSNYTQFYSKKSHTIIILLIFENMGKGQEIQKIGCMYLSILKIKMHTYDLGLQVCVRNHHSRKPILHRKSAKYDHN